MCVVASQVPREDALGSPFLSFIPSGHYEERTNIGRELGLVGR